MSLEDHVIGKEIGAYRVVSLLGQGGMGRVYEVEHSCLHVRFALKLLPRDLCTEQAIDSFRREAEVMAKLSHHHIIRVDDFGIHDGQYWLRMELAEGTSVGNEKARSLRDFAAVYGGRIEQRKLALVISDVLNGLAYAHQKGVVHRDLKPANILLCSDAAKISDFGLVRIVGEDWLQEQAERSFRASMSIGDAQTMGINDSSTLAAALVGTYEYMSPEQRAGSEAMLQSDVYSVGLLIYRLLTGRSLGMKTPSQLDSSLSDAWDDFLLTALEHDPRERYVDGVAMMDAFESVIQALGIGGIVGRR